MKIDFKNEDKLLGMIRKLIDKDEQYSHKETKFIFTFISKTSKSKIKNILNKIYVTKGDNKLLGDIPTKDLAALWKELIIDAINFLRINDARERSFKNKDFKSTPDEMVDARELNAYGIEELYSYFEEFTNFESILYGADEYYRDHVQHPLFVWLMGLHILNHCVESCTFRVSNIINVENKESANIEYSEKKNYEKTQIVSSAEIGAMWTIVALTHDLGYPLQKVDRINSQLQKMLEKFGRVDFKPSEFSIGHQHSYLVKHLLMLVSSSVELDNGTDGPRRFSTYIRPKYFTKYSKSWEVFDHGMISSLILLRSLTYFLETDIAVENGKKLNFEDARQFSIRAEMLHAIASHTTPKVYHILANNLAFILILCDDLHEWNRPTMSDIVSDEKSGVKSGALKVNLEKLNIDKEKSEIRCSLTFPQCAFDLQMKNTIRIFKTWNERLRPAVDDKKRKMKFTWSINFGKQDIPWKFDFNSERDVFNEIIFTGPAKKDTGKEIKYSLYNMKKNKTKSDENEVET